MVQPVGGGPERRGALRSARHPLTRGGTLLGDGDWIFLQGDGVTPEGEQPFLDRMNLALAGHGAPLGE
jgi:hypothetical protein